MGGLRASCGLSWVDFLLNPNTTQHDRFDLKSNELNPIVCLNPTQPKIDQIWVNLGWLV